MRTFLGVRHVCLPGCLVLLDCVNEWARRSSPGAVGRRNLICGEHVHVGIDDENLRIDVMSQVMSFLPVLLALSTSSPFWRADDTGLLSYRVSVSHALPRSGLPEHFADWSAYQAFVGSTLVPDNRCSSSSTSTSCWP